MPEMAVLQVIFFKILKKQNETKKYLKIIGGSGGCFSNKKKEKKGEKRLAGLCSSSASAPTVPVWPRSRFVRGGFGLSVAVRVALAQLPACRKLGKDVCLRLLSRDEP